MHDDEDDASSSDTRLVRELADVLVETGLTEIEIERGDLKIRVAKQAAAQGAVYATPPPAPPATAAAAPQGRPHLSPSHAATRSSRPWSALFISRRSRAPHRSPAPAT